VHGCVGRVIANAKALRHARASLRLLSVPTLRAWQLEERLGIVEQGPKVAVGGVS
jgi:hypothetical protein